VCVGMRQVFWVCVRSEMVDYCKICVTLTGYRTVELLREVKVAYLLWPISARAKGLRPCQEVA